MAPGDYHMVVESSDGEVCIRINQEKRENYCRPSTDPLFRSVASVFGAKTLVTVLTGVGNDGAVVADDEPWHNRRWSVSLRLPPLSTLVLQPDPGR